MLKKLVKRQTKAPHILNDTTTYMVFKSGCSVRCSVCGGKLFQVLAVLYIHTRRSDARQTVGSW